MSDSKKYILDYDGLKVITDNVAKRCVPANGFDAKINNTIYRVMRSFGTEFIQYAQSFQDLPPIGTSGMLYLVMKRPGDYIVYSFENNKYVQVGASTFKKDFEPDVALNINSTNMVTNAAITKELNKKYTKTGMVAEPIANSDELVESKGIKAKLDLLANKADFNLMNKYDLRKIFYTEYVNGAYLRIYLRFYNKDLLVDLANSGSYKPAIHKFSFGELTYSNYDSQDAIITDSVSTIPVRWRGTNSTYYNSTMRIGHRIDVGTSYSTYPSNHISRLFSNDSNWLRLGDLTDGNFWLEITFTSKIPVELLMDTTLTFNELMATRGDANYSYNRVLVHDAVYVTTEVSADAVHWYVWQDDQRMYDATAVEEGTTAGEGTYSIPIFR